MPALALPSHRAHRAEGGRENDPVTAPGRRFLGGGVSGLSLPPRTVRGLVDMTVTPPPVLPPPARSPRTTAGPIETAHDLGGNACSPMAVAGSHASTPSHVGTGPGLVTAPVTPRTARGRGSVSTDLDEGATVNTRTSLRARVLESTLQNLVSLLVGLTEKRNDNASVPHCGQAGTAADPRSRLEPVVAAETTAHGASARTVTPRRAPHHYGTPQPPTRRELKDLLVGCPCRGEHMTALLAGRIVRARLGRA